MKNLSLCVIAISVFILYAFPSSASTWTVEATGSTAFGQVFGDFTVVFNDAENDDTVFVSDITSFSGMRYQFPSVSIDTTYTSITKIPDFSIGSLNLESSTPGYAKWDFNAGGSFGDGYWTYNANEVPVPAAVWLLGSGLIGIVGLGRKFKK